jgi:hypothetical protein
VEATRARFGSLLEWLAAAACIVAVLAVGSVLVREFRTVSAVAPVIAHEDTQPEASAAVPPGSVSVPVILLPNGAELHVGDKAADLASRFGADREAAPAAIERTGSGERVTRFYEIDGRRIVVVLAPQAGDEQIRIVSLFTIPQT